jgi:hypothetical protein
MRFPLSQLLQATFALAALVIIVEHAGGFSKILGAGANAYATGFNALTGHPSQTARTR